MSVYELDRRLVRELVESVSIAARGSARGPARRRPPAPAVATLPDQGAASVPKPAGASSPPLAGASASSPAGAAVSGTSHADGSITNSAAAPNSADVTSPGAVGALASARRSLGRGPTPEGPAAPATGGATTAGGARVGDSPTSDLDDDAVARLFATATWSALAEPGDAVAGVVVAALGADQALSMLLEQRTPREWWRALGEEYRAVVSEADLAAGVERWRPRLSSRLAVAAFRSAANCRARLVTPGDAEWPRGFDGLGAHAPLALWVRGDARELSHAAGSIAIVGSRDATTYGEHVATELASGLSDRGFAVFSGAAYGIDGMAHRAALASRETTVAFLAGGVDRLYPAAHHDLLLRVEATGAIVSELPCGSAPTKWRFLHQKINLC
ncbi:DNA-processing protein DprA [Herbiconiux sp. 11R-BC]|uniref:DNA-processing protein DprA n=1 Tax=Herbiconiux sp. 11R-BC TaxID=3111637 RepID=UPI003C0612A1